MILELIYVATLKKTPCAMFQLCYVSIMLCFNILHCVMFENMFVETAVVSVSFKNLN